MLVSQNIFALKVLYLFCKKYLNTKSIFAPSSRQPSFDHFSLFWLRFVTFLLSTVDRVSFFFYLKKNLIYDLMFQVSRQIDIFIKKESISVTNAQIDVVERTLIHSLQRTLHCFTS